MLFSMLQQVAHDVSMEIFGCCKICRCFFPVLPTKVCDVALFDFLQMFDVATVKN
jgi:hypothetical protein